MQGQQAGWAKAWIWKENYKELWGFEVEDFYGWGTARGVGALLLVQRCYVPVSYYM